ncbi:MAG: proteasome accessory factor PafA2 family protein [bacterium]|nr:proteasome accessory factor PafA2 family protein [bacterium]
MENETAFFPMEIFGDNWAKLHDAVESLRPQMRDGARILPVKSDFLANGGRAYWDTGNHFEISTPECGSVYDLVAWGKAGERILEDIAATLNIQGSPASRIRAKFARFGGCTFFKNNTNMNSERWSPDTRDYRSRTHYVSWGNHYNLPLNIREVSYDEALPILGPFLFSSSWMTGSGLVWVTNGGRLLYSLSQRAPFVDRLSGTSSTAPMRPMVLLCDEPLADRREYWRLQIIGLDSSMCEWQMYVPNVILGILLRMIEGRVLRKEDYKKDSGRFSRELAYMQTRTMWWGSEHQTFRFQNEEYDAVRLHRKLYLEPILAYKASLFREAARSGSPVLWSNEEEDGLQKYIFLIEAFERARSPLECAEILAPYVGWAAKLHYWILPDMERNGYSFESAPILPLEIITKSGTTSKTDAWGRMKFFDNFFHDVRRDKGLYYKLVQKGLVALIVSESEILHAKNHAPSGTRAEARDKRIAALRGHTNADLMEVGWNYLRYYPKSGRGWSPDVVTEYDEDPFDPNPGAFQRVRFPDGV